MMEGAVPRTPVIAGNWKMHTTLAEARGLAAAVRDGCRGLTEIRVAVCPPFTALAAVAEVLAGSTILVGAQDAHWEASGAFTGSVSAAQIWDAGARLVLLGHSERRHGLDETDAIVRRKVTAALAQGLTPLVCVGETAAERAGGRTLAVVSRQVEAALGERPASEIGRAWLAYEPVWAIGTGQTATPAQAAEVHGQLRAALGRLADPTVAAGCPILYGGSVKPEVTPALMAEPDIDGALVGGASLKAPDFIGIVRAGLEAKGRAGVAAR
jgi:triosephosphate isomerase